MTLARRILILGGIALAIIGMCHGTWYAVFAEHQALDRMGGSLASAFTQAATRDAVEAQIALAGYREAKYVHDRQVDAHGHWIGLAMLLIVLGIVFDRVAFRENHKSLVAIGLLIGAATFPLSVLLQTFTQGSLPRMLSVASSALMIATLAITAFGFASARSNATATNTAAPNR
jgi:hypothetical protein